MADDDNNNRRDRFRPYWEKAYKDFQQPLSARARRLANGRLYDAEDYMQETFCRALTYARDPEEISNPLGYLLRVMRHVWIDKWASEQTGITDSLEELLSGDRPRNAEPAMESDIQRILENEQLRAKMEVQQGPLNSREKLLLKLHLEGYKCKEIAKKLNEDVRLTRSDLNAVRTKIRYRLRNRLEK
jgi:RNA polymerase sigma factor (sigma-70 family)